MGAVQDEPNHPNPKFLTLNAPRRMSQVKRQVMILYQGISETLNISPPGEKGWLAVRQCLSLAALMWVVLEP